MRRLPDGTDPGRVTVIGPSGDAVDSTVADNLLRVRDTQQSGIYQIRIGATTSSFAANLLSPEESEISPRPDLVLAAVAQNGDALKYAAEELRVDRNVVLAALAQNGATHSMAVVSEPEEFV